MRKTRKEERMIPNFEQYRQNTQYDGVYKYIAPEGTHWECMGTDYGKIIWGGVSLFNSYAIVEDKK